VADITAYRYQINRHTPKEKNRKGGKIESGVERKKR